MHAILTVLFGPFMTCVLPVFTPFPCLSASWSRFLGFCIIEAGFGFLHLLSSVHWWQVEQAQHGLNGFVTCCSQSDSSLQFTPVTLQRVGLSQGHETQIMISDAEYHAQIEQKQMKLFNAF